MNSKTTIRRITTFLATLTLVALAGAAPAQASISNVNGTVTGYASCNTYYHRLGMAGKVQLSSRFPNGTWVASRYAYWQVGPTGVRTGAYYYTTGQYTPGLPGTVYLPYTELGGAETVGQNTDLPGLTINNQWGHLKVALQVGVYTGSTYEWSTDNVWSYATYNQNGFLANNTMCIASVNYL